MIFNSLGSNYDFKFILKSLFSAGWGNSGTKLKLYLNKRYGGETVLLYKGREAIKLALILSGLPRASRVAVSGFTCYVVYQAVVEAGMEASFIDIKKDSLNFGVEELRKQKNLKAVIIQNTLGAPCDIDKISKYCKANNLVLIEDLAHSAGIFYDNGMEAGTVGDFTALSFSQDKMIDTVSGGALIVRNKNYNQKNFSGDFEKISLRVQLKDRLYPLFTFLVRKTYGSGFGKLLHFALKRFNLLSRPMADSAGIPLHNLPDWYCRLVLNQYSVLKKVIAHRESIGGIYSSILGSGSKGIVRFPFLTELREDLIKFLKSNKVFISDTWYDSPIAPKRYQKLTTYNGQCPVSQSVSEKIINLPTHINVSEKDAYRISRLIKIWQTTNQK